MMSREELLAKLLGTMQAPIVNFVRTLNEVPTKFVRGLAAVRDPKIGGLSRLVETQFTDSKQKSN